MLDYRDLKDRRISALETALRNLVLFADDGEYHCSEDCEAEKRTDDCALCGAIHTAEETLEAERAIQHPASAGTEGA